MSKPKALPVQENDPAHHRATWRHAELTQRIIGVAIEVQSELGHGFSESVYQRSMLIALEDAGMRAEAHQRVTVSFRGQSVGSFEADIIVDSKVLLELKAVSTLLSAHQAQVINYLQATKLSVGLLINFGQPRIQVRRLRLRDVRT